MSTTTPSAETVASLGPWISLFDFHGVTTGGWFDVMNDRRVVDWLNTVPNHRRVLECGSLEGGHTALIARHPGVEIVLGIEAREANLKKCLFTHKQLEITNSRFVQGNIETMSLAAFGEFDAMFCSGVFYHLYRPWKFWEQVSVPYVFLGTHYADSATDTFEGVQGHWYEEQGLADVLSGMSEKSFWMTLGDIERMLLNSGYVICNLSTSPHQNGPWVNIQAKRLNA